MQLVLVRHAQPILNQSDRINFSEYCHWTSLYDVASIGSHHSFSEELQAAISGSSIVICSALYRSIATAEALNLSVTHSESLLNEIILPKFYIPFIRLTPRYWGIVFRLFWQLLILVNPWHQDVLRARVAMQFLVSKVDNNCMVIFVGHGLFNYLLHRELKRQGWYAFQTYAKKYLSFSIYSK